MRPVSRSLTILAIAAFLCATPAFSQVVATDAYQLNYLSVGIFQLQNGTPVTFDRESVRIVNTGQVGSPIDATTKQGTVCADLYVFDTNQEMLECCSCPITANGLLTLDINSQLLGRTLTGALPPPIPITGGNLPGNALLKIVADRGCDETSITAPVNGGLRAFTAHGQNNLVLIECNIQTGICTPIINPAPPVETEFQAAPLTAAEQQFLGQTCSFVHYLGSGRGKCFCQPD